MSSNRSIGRIISINSQSIIAEIFDSMGNYINTIDGIRFVGEIGSYVSIYEIGRIIIGEIVSVNEKPEIRNRPMSTPNSQRQISISLLGEIVDEQFQFGVSRMPLIFSEVKTVTEQELNIMLATGNEEEVIPNTGGKTRAVYLPIGQSVVFPEYTVKVSIDHFFGFHFGIFGNTGAGKSNTVAAIIQTIFAKIDYAAKGAKFIVLDSNGEYGKAFQNLGVDNLFISVKQLHCDEFGDEETFFQIPVWALSADDWAILLNASEKTQLPVIKRAIDIANIFFSPGPSSDELKNHILASTILGLLNSSDSSSSKSDKVKAVLTTFNTQSVCLDTSIGGSTLRDCLKIDYGKMVDLEAMMQYLGSLIISNVEEKRVANRAVYSLEQFTQAVSFATLYEGSVGSQRIQEYTATLTARLQALCDGAQGKLFAKTSFTNLEDYIDSFIGENQIVVLDISSLDDASAEVTTKVLAKLLFDYLKRKPNKADNPLNLIIEEAHRFISNQETHSMLGYNIFERISKEGRKYGMLLGLSSQRPSELSKTVVSQCSNFIVHRVQNPDDIQYISKMVPYVNQSIINRLTYLQTGDALVFGTAINLPTLTRFPQANPQTDSANARISEKWYIE